METKVAKASVDKKELWDRLAKDDALKWIVYPVAVRDPEEFFETGKEDVKRYCLPFFKNEGFDYVGKRMLDIGCGVGRTTRFFSEIFGEAYGVDISKQMINLARDWNADRPNLHFDVGSGANLSMYEDNMFDFVFSIQVFHHIPRREMIRSYIHEIDRVLKKNGLFQIQFGRKWYRFLRFIPVHRMLLNWVVETGLINLYYKPAKLFGRQPIMGISLPPEELKKMLEDTSLIIEISYENTPWMWCKGKKR